MNKRLTISILCFFAFVFSTSAQTHGEELNFTVNYKYGLLNVKGGTANYQTKLSSYKQEPALRTNLWFKSTSFIDKMIKPMRDTLYSYSNISDLTPLFHYRSIWEGDYSYQEELFFKNHSNSNTKVQVKRWQKGNLRNDTIVGSNDAGYDFLNLFVHVRNLDYSLMKPNENHTISAVMGREVVAMNIRYIGKTSLNGNKGKKNNAIHYAIDITNKTFTESKNAIEIWISDDDNLIPLKVKAKLKIGAAEAVLSSYKNLKDESCSY